MDVVSPVQSIASRVVEARAPTRIDFGGGWTDVPPYPEEHGGVVCAIAIARYASASLVATPATESEALQRVEPRNGESAPLLAAAMRRAAVDDVHATLASDFPTGAGLGGSSAAGVAIQAALARWRGETVTAETLAERSRAVEVEELGVPGGRQDHYAAALGGALSLTFGAGTIARRLSLTPALRDALERRCLLVYTGHSRISGATITAVLEGYRAREAQVLDALARMKALAMQMVQALDDGDVDTLGALVAEHWVHQRALHPAISTPRIDEIVERAERAGAIGSKALGASGGGCVLVVARDGTEAAVARTVSALGTRIPFSIDETGVTVDER